MNVAILFNEPILSTDHPDFASEAGVLDSVRAIQSALSERGHFGQPVGVQGTAADLWDALRGVRADVIVNLCEGFAGESRNEPHVAACLELLNIPYTGSRPDCLALVHDKVRSKKVLKESGLPTAPFFSVEIGDSLPIEPLAEALRAGPLFVKPAAEDASLGVSTDSVVCDLNALRKQVAAMRERFGRVLIESYLAGREFNVAAIELPTLEVLPIAEVEFHTNAHLPWPIITYESKWAPGSAADLATPVHCPAEVEPRLAERLRTLAREAFRATGCRHYARVDLRTNDQGEPFILEVNANPDIGPAAGFEKSLNAFGWNYPAFVERLIETAVGQSSRRKVSTIDGVPSSRLLQ